MPEKTLETRSELADLQLLHIAQAEDRLAEGLIEDDWSSQDFRSRASG